LQGDEHPVCAPGQACGQGGDEQVGFFVRHGWFSC
jgi:hypothetical protein